MDEFLNSITIDTFKEEFGTQFRYLPVWKETTLYFPQDKIFYAVNKRFYEALVQNENILPTVNTTWKPVADNILLYVSDEVIQSSLTKAKENLRNNRFFAYLIDNQKKDILLTLTAHFVYEKSTGVVSNPSGGLIETSRSVKDVSQSFTVPAFVLKSSIYPLYSHTPYGRSYVLKYITILQPIASIGRIDNV